MKYKQLQEKMYDIKDKTRTDIFVDKISKLTKNGQEETEEMKKALKGFDISLETEKYDLPETIDEFKQQIMQILNSVSDDEYLNFMKNVSSKKNTIGIDKILTKGRSVNITTINPKWIPTNIIEPIIKITKDKMGSGEVYFSMVTGGDKKKKGDVNINGTIIEVKFNKGWLLEFPNAMRAIDEMKVECTNTLTRTDESLNEAIDKRLARRAVNDIKKYVKNKNNLEFLASLIGTKITLSKTNDSYAFKKMPKVTFDKIDDKVLAILNEAATILRWVYKPVKGSNGYYNELTIDILGYMKELTGYLNAKAETTQQKTSVGHLLTLIDLTDKSLEELRKEQQQFSKIAERISKTDTKYFLFAPTKKYAWNDIYQAYKNKFKDGDIRFQKLFEDFLDKAFTNLSTKELMKGAFDNVGIDTETILKNIAEQSFTKYATNDKWTYLLTIDGNSKKYATFSSSTEFRKGMDSLIIKPDLIFAEGQSASPRIYIEMLK